jgi:rhamnogalacturonan acetylesterase
MKKYIASFSLAMASFVCMSAKAQNTISAPVAQVQPQAARDGIAASPSLATDPGTAVRPPLPTAKNPNLPTLYLVGDSTVRNGKADGAGGQWGWGEPLVDYFDTSRINVVNRAIGGRSSRTYITEGRWDELLAMLKPGDFVVLQFGHNDSSPLDDTSRARGTLPGVGDESREIDNPLTKKHEVVYTYGWYIRKYMAETLAKGAIPIMCSPIPRKIWKDGKTVRNADSYGGWARQVAASKAKLPLSISMRSSRAATMRWARPRWNRCLPTRIRTPAGPVRN